MLIEEHIETIDLARDSDEEIPLVIEEKRVSRVNIKQEMNHKQNLITERLHNDLDKQFKELEKNIEGRHSGNAGNTVEEFIKTSEDNSNDCTQVNCNLTRNLLEELKSYKLSTMKYDIQKQLKYLDDQENKLDCLLATIPADHVQRHSLELKKRNMCEKLRQKLTEQENAISKQDKESNKVCFGSEARSTNVSEEKPKQNNYEIIEQEPNIAVYDNQNEKTCNDKNDTIAGIVSTKESVNQNMHTAPTFDICNQENENSSLTVQNPTKSIDTTPAVDCVHQSIDTGPTVSVLQQLDPRNMSARIIFEDEDDDDDFYFGLGNNEAVDTSTKYCNAIDQTTVIDITDEDSNSGEVRGGSDCINPYWSHNCSQILAQERAASNKSLLLDKYKIEQVAYVKELIRETNKEFTGFKNNITVGQLAIEGSVKEAVNENQVHVVQKEIIYINQSINQTISIKKMSEHDHTYTKIKSLTISASQNINQIDENKCSEPTSRIHVNMAEKVNNESGDIEVDAINLHRRITMQHINAHDMEMNSVNKERNMSKNIDGASSSNMNQQIENHIQLEHEQCFINQEHKDDHNEAHKVKLNLYQSEPNISDVVQYDVMQELKDLDESNQNVAKESVDSDMRKLHISKSVDSIIDSCESKGTKSINRESSESIDVVRLSRVNNTSDSDVNKNVPIELKLDNTKDTTAGEHKSTIDTSEANAEKNNLKLDALEPSPGSSNINVSMVSCPEDSAPGASICWELNEISDSEHSQETSVGEENQHQEDIGEWRITTQLVFVYGFVRGNGTKVGMIRAILMHFRLFRQEDSGEISLNKTWFLDLTDLYSRKS